jgi:hypothetical protein
VDIAIDRVHLIEITEEVEDQKDLAEVLEIEVEEETMVKVEAQDTDPLAIVVREKDIVEAISIQVLKTIGRESKN